MISCCPFIEYAMLLTPGGNLSRKVPSGIVETSVIFEENEIFQANYDPNDQAGNKFTLFD